MTKGVSGNTKLVLEELARSGGPLSVYGLSLATGLTHRQVGSVIQWLRRCGEVTCEKRPKGNYYKLYEKPKSGSGSGQIAGKIIYPGYVYGASRLG